MNPSRPRSASPRPFTGLRKLLMLPVVAALLAKLFYVGRRLIRARRAAEDALRESRHRFERSFADAPIGMALVSTDGDWLEVNPALCRLLGYDRDELLRLTFQDITHPDDLEADLGRARRLLAGDIDTYQMEKRYFHKEGRVVWVLLSVSLVREQRPASPGDPLYFIAQIQDVTDQKDAEEHVRHLNRTLEERVVLRTTQLAERERQLEELVGKLLDAQEEERRRVAYEVHDGPTQLVIAPPTNSCRPSPPPTHPAPRSPPELWIAHCTSPRWPSKRPGASSRASGPRLWTTSGSPQLSGSSSKSSARKASTPATSRPWATSA